MTALIIKQPLQALQSTWVTKHMATRHMLIRHIIALALTLCGSMAYASENVVVITNTANMQKISPQDIANIYHDRITTWNNGTQINIYNLPVASLAREVFSQKILHMSAQKAAAAESNRNITNTTRNPQYIKRAQLIPYLVGSQPGAIAYVRESSIKNRKNIRIIAILKSTQP